MSGCITRRPPGSPRPGFGSRVGLLLLVGLGLTSPAWAQRHDKRMTGLGVVYGATDQGRFLEGSWTRYVSDKTYLRLGGSLARPDHLLGGGAASSAYGLSLALAPQLFQLGETVYVHLLAGGLFRYERLNENYADQDPSGVRQHLAGGPLLGTEADVFLGNRVSLVGTVQKALVFPGTGLTRWPGYYGLGLRYHLR